MRRILFVTSFFSLLFLSCFSQGVVTLRDKEFVYNPIVDSTIWKKLNTSTFFTQLQPSQKEFFYWVNVFRKSPHSFFNKEIAAFLNQYPEANTSEAKSLQTDLLLLKPLPFIMPDEGLTKMSRRHADDLAKRGGLISHVSSDGKSFQKRFNEAGFYRIGAENIFYGSPNPLEALIILLIDHGVPDKGHRLNLMDSRFNRMGVTSLPISSRKVILVQELGGL